MARAVTVRLPHELGREEARRRIEQGFGSLEEQLAGASLKMRFQERWEGDRMHFSGGPFGQKISGHVDVGDEEVVVEVVLPALLAALADKIRGRLSNQGARLLEHRR